jgi:hypothetical protein
MRSKNSEVSDEYHREEQLISVLLCENVKNKIIFFMVDVTVSIQNMLQEDGRRMCTAGVRE